MSKTKSYDSLSALYNDHDIAESIEQKTDFTIHKMQEVHTKPTTSPVFRANYFSFLLVESGKSFYTIDDHRFEVGANTLYFTNPGHLKSFGIQAVVRGYIITTNETYLKENLHNDIFKEFNFLLSETVPPTPLSDNDLGELRSLASQIENAYLNDSALRDRIVSSLFMAYLLKIKELLMANTQFVAEMDRDSVIVQTFKTQLEKQMRKGSIAQNTISVSAFAEAQSLHAGYFSTVIKTKTGESPSYWIQKKMLNEAKALLKNSGQPIKNIAYTLGFSEPTHFTKFFKKGTETSPRAYRKAHS